MAAGKRSFLNFYCVAINADDGGGEGSWGGGNDAGWTAGDDGGDAGGSMFGDILDFFRGDD